MRSAAAGLLAALALAIPARAAPPPDEDSVERLALPQANVEALRALGSGVMPVLARLYERSDTAARTQIAYAFYALGFKSPEAKRALMADARTADPRLRLQVQWALGRVSNDPDVVAVLLDNMQNDDNPLFRDKAACALAYDQIHLSEPQRLVLFERLIRALRDPKQQVRQIALQALTIHTGQNKGFDPAAPAADREAAVRAWEAWLEKYRSSR